MFTIQPTSLLRGEQGALLGRERVCGPTGHAPVSVETTEQRAHKGVLKDRTGLTLRRESKPHSSRDMGERI